MPRRDSHSLTGYVFDGRPVGRTGCLARAQVHQGGEMDPRLGAGDRSPIGKFLLLLSATVGLLIWAHWTDLVETAQHWGQDAQYSHGYLVPAFALGLLWQRRALLQQASPAPAWWGIPILAAGIGLHLAGAYFYYTWIDALSLL